MTKQDANEKFQQEEDEPAAHLHEIVRKEGVKREIFHVNNNIAEKYSEQDHTSQEPVYKPLQKSTSIRKEPQWFKINAIPRTFRADEPAVRKALYRDDHNASKSAISREVSNLQRMSCWNIATTAEWRARDPHQFLY